MGSSRVCTWSLATYLWPEAGRKTSAAMGERNGHVCLCLHTRVCVHLSEIWTDKQCLITSQGIRNTHKMLPGKGAGREFFPKTLNVSATSSDTGCDSLRLVCAMTYPDITCEGLITYNWQVRYKLGLRCHFTALIMTRRSCLVPVRNLW